jgi:membrane protein
MVQGLNAIHGTPSRAGVMPIVRALVMTVVLMGVGIVSLVSFLVVPLVFALLPLGPAASLVLTTARWVIALVTLAVGLAVLYRHGPNRSDRSNMRILPGLAVAMAGWAAAAFGFSQFLTNFGNYNEIYGSIGAVIALMMWFYISAYAVLIGAAVNARLERRQQ